MKRVGGFVIAWVFGLLCALAIPATAQTDLSAKVSQLNAYVVKLAGQYVEYQKRSTAELTRLATEQSRLALEHTKLKDAHNELVAWTLDLGCRYNNTNIAMLAISKATDAQPHAVTLIFNKACGGINDPPQRPVMLD